MTIWEFEQAIWELEGVRVVVRVSNATKVDEYPYQNAAKASWTLTSWLNSRVIPQLNGEDIVVIGGDGESPNGNTQLVNVRRSYGS